MNRSSTPRKTACLSKSVHQQLNMYAIAAGAAGVGVLALAGPAEAKIIYTQTHVVIGTNPPPTLVWTRDQRLRKAAEALGIHASLA
jgi:hypothetical protein